jgi:flagellar motor switch protein FliG
MSNGRTIVITAYGHDKIIDKIAVSSFELSEDSYYSAQNSGATTYCDAINSLELQDDSWVLAKIISENQKYALDQFLPLKLSDIIIQLDDRAIQKILREIDSLELAKALKGLDEIVKEKIFANMSKRASQMLKEDMEFMGPVRTAESKECQGKLLDIIRHFEQTGEIIIP